MTRDKIPLARWEARIWLGGAICSALIAVLFAALVRGNAPGWLAGGLAVLLILAVTALAAVAIRRAHDHQTRMQDEAETVRGRFSQWMAWLPKSEHAAPAIHESQLALTPQSLAEISLISDRIRTVTMRLQHDRAEANAVLASLDGGVIALDLNCRITLINRAAKQFFQIKRSCLGLPLIEVVRQPELIESVKRVLRTRSSTEVSVDILTDEGRRRSLRVRCSMLQYGDVSGILIAAHDESETKHIEEVRREFVANVSHELKTPLAAIKGYAETVELAIADDPDAAKHFVSQIQEQCKRLESLIADMMTLARAQSGRQHLSPTMVDLAAIIAESIKTYAPVAAARRIALSQTALQDTTVLVFADREATLTIANNVIGNAIRYTPEGGKVVASCRLEGEFGVLAVEDNGIGIPEHEQRRIFERFYRVDKSRKHASSGTGLGLSIVKNLSQAQGGDVRLKSRQGEGSRFEIFLPVREQPPAEPALGDSRLADTGSVEPAIPAENQSSNPR